MTDLIWLALPLGVVVIYIMFHERRDVNAERRDQQRVYDNIADIERPTSETKE